MPISDSITRRSEPRDAMFTQVRAGRRLSGRGFILEKVFAVVKRLPAAEAVFEKYTKSQDDRLVRGLLDLLIEHHLQRMVHQAIRGYDADNERLVTEEEMEKFSRYLVGRKITFIGQGTLLSASALFAQAKLVNRYNDGSLALYVVQRFNETLPLTSSIVASIEFGDVVLSTRSKG